MAHIAVDSFGGSGSTLIASEKLRRRARLIGFDPKYVDVIIRQWQEYTGEKAIRLLDSVTFNNLTADLVV